MPKVVHTKTSTSSIKSKFSYGQSIIEPYLLSPFSPEHVLGELELPVLVHSVTGLTLLVFPLQNPNNSRARLLSLFIDGGKDTVGGLVKLTAQNRGKGGNEGRFR